VSSIFLPVLWTLGPRAFINPGCRGFVGILDSPYLIKILSRSSPERPVFDSIILFGMIPQACKSTGKDAGI